MEIRFTFRSVLLILNLLFIRAAFSLVPLESIILGDLSENYEKGVSDPINYIFGQSDNLDQKDWSRNELELYRAFFDEGENLANFCEFTKGIEFPNRWQKDEVIRSFMANLQYIGLDITTQALVAYGKYFEFSEEEWNNLSDHVIGNYCSKNISIISLKQLRKNFEVKFKQGVEYKLPSVDGNRYFTSKLKTINSLDKMRELELLHTVKLFRAFCSWGGNVSQPRLMTPILKNAAIMSFVIRKAIGKKIIYNSTDGSTRFGKEESPVNVICNNLICRKKSSSYFFKNMARSIGFRSTENDFQRIYCGEFKELEIYGGQSNKQIKAWIEGQTFDDFNFLAGQFTALITGVPDFLLRLDHFDKGKNLFKMSLDSSWDKWANFQNIKYKRDILFEESLKVEKVNRKHYFNPKKSKFMVYFDVNLGEFDRINQLVGKIKVHFDLNISKSFLSWIRGEWIDRDPLNKKKIKYIKNVFKKHIENNVILAKNEFRIPIWKGDLGALIVSELLEQISLYSGRFFDQERSGNVKIPIYIALAPFALKYIHRESKILINSKKLDYSAFEYND